MKLPCLLISFAFAFHIPAVKDGDSGIYKPASASHRDQALFRRVIQENTWPVRDGRPSDVSQSKWVNSLLRCYSDEAEHVWVPTTLWELFLAWKQFELHPEHLGPSDALFEHDQDYKSWPDGHVDKLIKHFMVKFADIYYPKCRTEDSLLFQLETEFLDFLAIETSVEKLSFYTKKTRELLINIFAKIKSLIPDDKLGEYPRASDGLAAMCGIFKPGQDVITLGLLANAFIDEVKALESGDVPFLCEAMVEEEYDAYQKDEYLIVRVTKGVLMVKDVADGDSIIGLDSTRSMYNRSPYGLLTAKEGSYSEYAVDTEDKIESSRMKPFSYGYSLLAGGWQEVFMPRGACCLAYSAYPQGRPIVYIVRIDRKDIKDLLSGFLQLPPVPLQLGYFGYGEYFHPRLGPYNKKYGYDNLGVLAEELITAENEMQDSINMFLASRSKILSFNHQVIADPKIAERIIGQQYLLADVKKLQKEQIRIDLESCHVPFYLNGDYSSLEPAVALLAKKANHCANRVIRILSFLKEELQRGKTIEEVREIPHEDHTAWRLVFWFSDKWKDYKFRWAENLLDYYGVTTDRSPINDMIIQAIIQVDDIFGIFDTNDYYKPSLDQLNKLFAALPLIIENLRKGVYTIGDLN